jgi:hypothetical protein
MRSLENSADVSVRSLSEMTPAAGVRSALLAKLSNAWPMTAIGVGLILTVVWTAGLVGLLLEFLVSDWLVPLM